MGAEACHRLLQELAGGSLGLTWSNGAPSGPVGSVLLSSTLARPACAVPQADCADGRCGQIPAFPSLWGAPCGLCCPPATSAAPCTLCGWIWGCGLWEGTGHLITHHQCPGVGSTLSSSALREKLGLRSHPQTGQHLQARLTHWPPPLMAFLEV